MKIHCLFKSYDSRKMLRKIITTKTKCTTELKCWVFLFNQPFSECSWTLLGMCMQKCSKYPCANKLNGCRLPKNDLLRMWPHDYDSVEIGNVLPRVIFYSKHSCFAHSRRYLTRKKRKDSICQMKDRKLQWYFRLSADRLSFTVQCTRILPESFLALWISSDTRLAN